MSTITKHSRIMEILERKTGGHSYKSHKYSFDDSERSMSNVGKRASTISKK